MFREFRLGFIRFVLLFEILSGEPKQNQGRGLVDRKLVQATHGGSSSRPTAALLFWFFGVFRCVALLFMVILVIY